VKPQAVLVETNWVVDVQTGCDWVGFCELDSDLQPWDKFGDRKTILSDLYNDSRIWVYGNFSLQDVNNLPNDWIQPNS
jgi:hypothetical protein